MTRKIAIYGKGGIGKSTISSNISYALGYEGKKVLQIGCDPKHDSTRLLLNGKKIEPVLEYMRRVVPNNYKLSDLIFKGANDIDCVEVGGPEPGVGCAGRGILLTLELLDDMGIRYEDYEMVLYDVLGDVVCGGFAMPLRKENSDAVYIVTSGEFMSIYAANNILRGLSNYGEKDRRCGGIIYNSRGLMEEDKRIQRFSDAVELPVIVKIPRDELFAKAEKLGRCLGEDSPESETAQILTTLGRKILTQTEYYHAKPMEDEELKRAELRR